MSKLEKIRIFLNHLKQKIENLKISFSARRAEAKPKKNSLVKNKRLRRNAYIVPILRSEYFCPKLSDATLYNYSKQVVMNSDRPKQDFMAETEPKPNFGYNSSFGRNRNTKKIEINDFERT